MCLILVRRFPQRSGRPTTSAAPRGGNGLIIMIAWVGWVASCAQDAFRAAAVAAEPKTKLRRSTLSSQVEPGLRPRRFRAGAAMLGGAPGRVNLALPRHTASDDRYAMIARTRVQPARTSAGKQVTTNALSGGKR
jgi:hypothetical protein